MIHDVAIVGPASHGVLAGSFATVKNCRLLGGGGGAGILVEVGGRVEGNTIRASSSPFYRGIRCDDGRCTVERNIIGQASNDCIMANGSGNRIVGNHVENCGGRGIFVRLAGGQGGNLVEDNTVFSTNGVGIEAENRATIRDNGLDVTGGISAKCPASVTGNLVAGQPITLSGPGCETNSVANVQ